MFYSIDICFLFFSLFFSSGNFLTWTTSTQIVGVEALRPGIGLPNKGLISCKMHIIDKSHQVFSKHMYIHEQLIYDPFNLEQRENWYNKETTNNKVKDASATAPVLRKSIFRPSKCVMSCLMRDTW